MPDPRIVHLSAAGVSVLLVQRDDALPVLAHWGRALEASDADLGAYAASGEKHGIDGHSDLPYAPSLLPEHAAGWAGRPGLSVHRAGAAWTPRMRVRTVEVDGRALSEGEIVQSESGRVIVRADDEWARMSLEVEIDLTAAGLLRTRATVRNDDDGPEPLEVQDVSLALAVPPYAGEMLDFAGRWGTERIPQRVAVTAGVHSRPSRRGRTGLDATTVLALGTPGFDAASGEVWVGHVGIGGDHEHAAERLDGVLALRLGELLLPGEVRLGAGEQYRSPWVFGSYGEGLDAAAHRFHAYLRGISRSSRRPRPVTVNVWEAVYFNQDRDTILELADRAAELGAERFVLDDGWFLGRDDDRAGLGDWSADPQKWPDGLGPLADAVRARGMEFGLWVEPEMINEDSDLARAHPDWILRARPELPPAQRFQQVLDLTDPEAFAHILDTLDGLVRDLGVAYLKWDHNRDLVAAGHPATGAPAVHDQTLALYRLLDELRERHPDLEIESCASGGGRVDLGILERTDRVHTSDNHDPLDRARMLRWTGLLVPPEMLGSHVASPVSSVTGRTHELALRCAVAFLGHFGVEWDIRELSDEDRTALAGWIAGYKRLRGLVQTGAVVGDGDFHPSAPSVRGVVAEDRGEAVYTILTPSLTPDTSRRVRLTGLDPARRYRVTAAVSASLGPPWHVPDWLRGARGLDAPGEAPTMSGSLLSSVGLDVPTFLPERSVVIHLRAVEASA